jgi:DNA-binding response OmpR family regulator
MRIIGVFTKDDYLYRKIELELSRGFDVRRISSAKAARECELVLFDGERRDAAEYACRVITLSYGDDADMKLPLPLGAIEKALAKSSEGSLTFHEGSRTVTLADNTIRLTEIEHSLLTLLAKGAGSFVDREEISRTVWDGRADDRLINLYIHYLREKLEVGGERVILSSRKQGYAIDKKFLGGKIC